MSTLTILGTILFGIIELMLLTKCPGLLPEPLILIHHLLLPTPLLVSHRESIGSYDDRDLPNCELSDRDTRELDLQNPNMFDSAAYDYYERSAGRNGYDGECLDGKYSALKSLILESIWYSFFP